MDLMEPRWKHTYILTVTLHLLCAQDFHEEKSILCRPCNAHDPPSQAAFQIIGAMPHHLRASCSIEQWSHGQEFKLHSDGQIELRLRLLHLNNTRPKATKNMM